jgi:hypothetical protein
LSVALVKPTAIAKHEGIEQVEAAMLNLPQADCPLVHRFGPGLYIRESDIEGQGLFLSAPVAAGAIIAPGRLDGKRTPAGRYVNHSATPNCFYIKTESDDVYLIAKRDIIGCQGGDQGEELTVDYRQGISLADAEAKICHL